MPSPSTLAERHTAIYPYPAFFIYIARLHFLDADEPLADHCALCPWAEATIASGEDCGCVSANKSSDFFPNRHLLPPTKQAVCKHRKPHGSCSKTHWSLARCEDRPGCCYKFNFFPWRLGGGRGRGGREGVRNIVVHHCISMNACGGERKK